MVCAAVLAPNHFSQADHFFAGIYIFRRKIRYMAKSQLFGFPVLTYIVSHGGVFPVRRGHRDEEAMKTAFTVTIVDPDIEVITRPLIENAVLL